MTKQDSGQSAYHRSLWYIYLVNVSLYDTGQLAQSEADSTVPRESFS